MARITPYTRSPYPTIEGNDRVYFDNEFRKIQECLRTVINAISMPTAFKTIATGAFSVDSTIRSIHFIEIDTEAAAATDDLDTISGGNDGQIIILRATNSARTVVCKDGTGNLMLAGDHSLDNTQDTITLYCDEENSRWIEIARSNNGA